MDAGYKCDSVTCWVSCGDLVVDASEECDLVDAGCVGCTIATGWECTPTSCSEICGDGLIVGTEACDDGNVIDNDGCN